MSAVRDRLDAVTRPDDNRHGLPPFDPRPFAVSPLYSTLCTVVAADPALLAVADETRDGQQPEFALFGAVHLLLLAGEQHDLRQYYPSVVGDVALPPDTVGPVFTDFVTTHRSDIVEQISTRLVQTNQVRRAVGLRTALAVIAPHLDGAQTSLLVEIGSSAGLLLRQDRYGYHVGGRRFGDPDSSVQLVCELIGEHPLPDLDALPRIETTVGVDLAPVDPTDPDSRAWLEALVWPEDHEQRRLLTAALELAAADPPSARAGDAIDVLPDLGAELSDAARIVFHCATRMHVPVDRLAAFDAAIDGLSAGGPVWRIAIEAPPDPDPRPSRPGGTAPAPGAALTVTDPSGTEHLVAVVNGHLRWIEPTPNALIT